MPAGDARGRDARVTCDVTLDPRGRARPSPRWPNSSAASTFSSTTPASARSATSRRTPDDEWHRVLDVNVVGIAQGQPGGAAASAALRRTPRSSTPARWSPSVGVPQRAVYSASKGAVAALTLAMAADHVRDGIRVNAVTPGTADTPWVGRLLDQAAGRRGSGRGAAGPPADGPAGLGRRGRLRHRLSGQPAVVGDDRHAARRRRRDGRNQARITEGSVIGRQNDASAAHFTTTPSCAAPIVSLQAIRSIRRKVRITKSWCDPLARCCAACHTLPGLHGLARPSPVVVTALPITCSIRPDRNMCELPRPVAWAQ